MKTIILTLLAAGALASPALAHSQMRSMPKSDSLTGIHAQAMPAATAVSANGETLGADPDPQVRLQMLRNDGFLDR